MGLFESFGVNWKILFGQIINFLILFYLLKRFAFKPFLNVLKERREVIQSGVEKETRAREKLEMVEKEREKILKETQKKAELILKEKEKEGIEREERILKEAEKEKERILAEGKRLAQIELKRMKKGFYQKNLALVFALTEKILKEKIDLEKDKEIIKKFLEK